MKHKPPRNIIYNFQTSRGKRMKELTSGGKGNKGGGNHRKRQNKRKIP